MPPSNISIDRGTTTFSQIYDTFSRGGKKDFGMRFDGEKNVLYTHSRAKLHGRGEEAATARTQKKDEARKVIQEALTTEFGKDFAMKVMVRLQTDRGLDLREGTVTRGQLKDIRETVDQLQDEMLSTTKDGYNKDDSAFLKSSLSKLHSDPQALRAAANEHFTPDKVRSMVLGNPNPKGLQEMLEKDLIQKWTPTDTEGMSKKEIRQETRKIEAMAKQVVAESLAHICDELGVVPSGAHFSLNAKGFTRLEGMRPDVVDGTIKQSEIETLAGLRNNPEGLTDYLDNNPQVVFKLLATPRGDLEKFFEVGSNVPDLDVPQMLEALKVPGKLYLDEQGFHCESERLKDLLSEVQKKPGVKADYAYRVEVELHRMGGGERIGGENLTIAANKVAAEDVSARQQIPPQFQVLSRAEMAKVGAALNDPDPEALKTLMKTDRELMIKLATTLPGELESHLALTDRGDLTVKQAYDRILAALPGHDATLKDGVLDTITIGDAQYKTKVPKGFGDAAGYGDILMMERQGDDPPGSEPRIVLKKLKVPVGQNPDDVWKMMSNEIRLHSHLSEKTDQVVKILEPVRVGNDLYMAMECCDGGSLTGLVFHNGVGQLAKQSGMDPKVELALKLSYMQGMLEPLAYLGEIEKVVHQDVKGGNFLVRGDGSVVVADLGTSSYGSTATNYGSVDNPEQHSPESIVHKKAGPPYGEIGHKSDCFAFGHTFARFMCGFDMHGKFGFVSQMEDLLVALHDNPNGFDVPLMPPLPPDVPLASAQLKYERDFAKYEKAKQQMAIIGKAGFTIDERGAILPFPTNGNPVKELALMFLQGNEEQRASAAEALMSHAMTSLNDPELSDALKEMRSLIAEIDVEELNDGKVQNFKMTEQQMLRFEAISERISTRIAAGDQELWDSMFN